MREYSNGYCHKLATIITAYYKRHYGIFIDSNHIGFGLYYNNVFQSRISKGAYIGNNVNISHYSNFGTNSGRGLKTGNNIYIAPHVCTVSDNNIGSNVCIGAGAVVTKDLMAGGTYAGNPAKRIGDNKYPEYIRNPYPIPSYIPKDKIEDIEI